jgi:BCD family chlorophyll transporter-like MFS transporter
MRRFTDIAANAWTGVGLRFLPFADAASQAVPLSRLLRLSLFQISVGMAVTLLNGTLNRVMIVELGVAGSLVALMVSLPLLFAPMRALIGYRSDTHRSVLGWRRVPYIWIGTLLQFGGLAIMPFALIVLSGDTHGPAFIGQVGAALAFLLVGAGLHTTQTAGLALATDLAPVETRGRIVAFMYVMLLVGMVASSLILGALLADFGQIKLIQVVQGAAALTMILNIIALWKQETRNPSLTDPQRERVSFGDAWKSFSNAGRSRRTLVAVGLGTAGFSMQDILLEPYGGELLHLSVAATTMLTAVLATGTLAGLGLAARQLSRRADPYRLAGFGALAGVVAFPIIIFAAPFESSVLLCTGTALIGFGGGLFAVGTLSAAMLLARDGHTGIALGSWGAVQATAAGLAVGFGGMIRDGVGWLAVGGALGPALTASWTGYIVVYHIEIVLLFATLAAIGPLVRSSSREAHASQSSFALAEMPA